jgi:hypothetical protein
MKAVAAGMGRDEKNTSSFIDGLMKKLDSNKDGVITRDEWIKEGLKTPSLLILLGVDQ